MAVLAIFEPDTRALARLHGALGEHHELVLFADWAALHEALERLPADGCLLDPYQRSQPVTLTDIQVLRERYPSLAIMVYADFKGHEMDLFTLGRLQIDGVVPAGRDEGIRQIRETVAEALASSVAARVLTSLSPHLPRLALDCIKWAIEHCHHLPNVEAMSDSFALSPRSLARLLRRGGAPSPGRLLLWGRLFRAAHLLGERNATVEQVAFTIGYSSGAALSRALRRETGYSTSEVLRRGGIGCVLDGFARRELKPPAPRPAVRWRMPRAVAAPRER